MVLTAHDHMLLMMSKHGHKKSYPESGSPGLDVPQKSHLRVSASGFWGWGEEEEGEGGPKMTSPGTTLRLPFTYEISHLHTSFHIVTNAVGRRPF